MTDRSVTIRYPWAVDGREERALRTREALVNAGLTVAQEHGFAGMSVNRVVQAAGVAKGTFYVHFPDRGAFLAALHQRFHDGVSAAVQRSVGGLPPGRRRLDRGLQTYLDECQRATAVKAMLLEARNDDAVADAVALRNEAFAALAAPDLTAMGWPEPVLAARMIIAMAAEAALIELVGSGPDQACRATLAAMLDRLDLSSGTAPPPASDRA
jgi:TetR/AcrR family transcriptional regulator, transcriptional repressor for nem operon